ncbi:hypothetical protein AB1N83_013882, partial [Pleurotus pulmonarius]
SEGTHSQALKRLHLFPDARLPCVPFSRTGRPQVPLL